MHIGVLKVATTLCKSYCISTWGGAPKTTLLKLERAQRAVLKTSYTLPFLYPTDELFQKCEVLTVRQLFILATVLRKHSEITYNPNLLKARRNYTVCVTPACSTALSHRSYFFLSGYLYNKINKALSIYPLNTYETKKYVSNWLQKLNYDKTESLLNIT